MDFVVFLKYNWNTFYLMLNTAKIFLGIRQNSGKPLSFAEISRRQHVRRKLMTNNMLASTGVLEVYAILTLLSDVPFIKLSQ